VLLLLQAALVGAVACLSSMIGYCVYSVLYPQLQQRRIDAARRKRFRMVAVQVGLLVLLAEAAAAAAGNVRWLPFALILVQLM
jgi:drug/metabolite transporter (DMT)-like permease